MRASEACASVEQQESCQHLSVAPENGPEVRSTVWILLRWDPLTCPAVSQIHSISATHRPSRPCGPELLSPQSSPSRQYQARNSRCQQNSLKLQQITSKHTHHLRQMSGALRSVPSPLHGTSHRMRSNMSPSSFLPPRPLRFSSGKFCASWFVTMIDGLDIRFVWWINRWHRCTSASFAMTKPSGVVEESPACSISSSCAVLDPGAAHTGGNGRCE